MKAILVVDIPDEVWKNKEKDLGMYVELWSERIDKDWFGKYYSDSLKPMPEKIETPKIIQEQIDGWFKLAGEYIGYNACIDELLGEEE